MERGAADEEMTMTLREPRSVGTAAVLSFLIPPHRQRLQGCACPAGTRRV